jgi:hypothetical protein
MKSIADLTMADYATVHARIIQLSHLYGVEGAGARLPSILEGIYSAAAIQRFRDRASLVVALKASRAA